MVEDQPNPQNRATSLHDPNKRHHLAHEVIKNYVLESCQILFQNGYFGYKWDPDEEKTTIKIVDKYSFNLAQVDSSPVIVTSRAPQQWGRTSGFRQMQHINMKTDERIHSDLVKGSVRLSVFARQGIEAENIAGFLFEAFQSLRDVLRRMTGQGKIVPPHLAGLFRVESMTLGEEALVKSGSRSDIHVVPTIITAMAQRRWSTRPNARKLQGIDVRINKVNNETL